MNKIVTVYELLGLIKDDNAPKKIKHKGDTYIYAGDDYSINDNREDWLITKHDYFLTNFLTEEVEILDEDKPIIEKLNIDREPLRGREVPRAIDYLLEGRINEIIDYINRKEDK